MEVNANIMITPDDAPTAYGDEAAAAILTALGGDPATDYCTVSFVQTNQGKAGTEPPNP